MTNKKSLLIIDDDEPFLQALTKQIELHEEFLLTKATTGESALEKTKADTFDVIILDIGLPDMNGREVCRLMRRNGVTAWPHLEAMDTPVGACPLRPYDPLRSVAY